MNQKLYNMFSQYSDEQLNQVMISRNYSNEAKSIASAILQQRNNGAMDSLANNQAAPAPAAPSYGEAVPAPTVTLSETSPASPYSAPAAPSYAAPAAPAYSAPAQAAPVYSAPAAAPYGASTPFTAQRSKLYPKFIRYSDIQLRQILAAGNYSLEAKKVASAILQERSGSGTAAEAPSEPAPGASAYPSGPNSYAYTNTNYVAPASESNPYTNRAFPPEKAAEAMRLFAQLLDMGAVTQEEFDAKRKQLLGQ